MSSTTSASITVVPTTSTSPGTSSTGSSVSTTRDNLGGYPTGAPGSSPSPSTSPSSDTPSTGLVSYYYVFFAIALCIAAMVGFFLWRRRRMLASRNMQSRPDQQSWGNQSGWYGYHGSRQQWVGHGAAEEHRVEGLNEDGEAPPPYLPKSDELSRRPNSQNGMRTGAPTEESIPLQDMSRSDAAHDSEQPTQTPGAQQTRLPGYHEVPASSASTHTPANIASSSTAPT